VTTLEDANARERETRAEGGVVSPFADAAKATMGDVDVVDDAPKLPLTMENVDNALDEVRPYLIADGGNVELVEIEDGIVVVRLNGACGTCASSSATMKGGIEKLLKQKFGDAVEEVVNVSGELEEMTIETIEGHLEKLRKSITSYGGEVSVESLERGVCVLRFKGPQALAFSIAQAIKTKFPLVRECKIRQVK
jgi:Fe-S cluster biogenesis protein NfuA